MLCSSAAIAAFAACLASVVVARPAAAAAQSIRRANVPAGVPSFAVDLAPLVYLYSADPFRPSDLGAQVANTQPKINLTSPGTLPPSLNLDNLDELNQLPNSANGDNVYLTSIDYIDIPGTIPEWIKGVTPDASGATQGATSCAVIINRHPDNKTVDVFYMYFYAYNWGGLFLDVNLDDHVGDWEHNMIRFVEDQPESVWFSQHSNGQAFTYDALHKDANGRPYVYSANGSHANYAINGTHDHTLQIVNLPDGADFLEDYTDNGPVWDPTLGAYFYEYDAETKTFTPYGDNVPVSWLYFNGKWGDDTLPDSDPRQVNFLDLGIEYKYDAGPTGPLDKQLNRTDVCPSNGFPCIVYPVAIA